MGAAAAVAAALTVIAVALVGRDYAAFGEETLETGRAFVALHCEGEV